MNYEMPKMEIVEFERDNIISTLDSVAPGAGGNTGFIPGTDEDEW